MEVWGRREEFLKYIKHKKNTRNKQTHASPYHQYVVQRELAPVLPLDAAAPHDVRHDGNSLGEVKPGRQGAGGEKGGNEIGNDNVFTHIPATAARKRKPVSIPVERAQKKAQKRQASTK